MKAMIYAAGCALETVDAVLPWETLEIHLNYVAGWARDFFGFNDGLVTTIPVAQTLPGPDGRFRVAVTDFSRSRMRINPCGSGCDRATGNLRAELVPLTGKGESGTLRVAAEYPGRTCFHGVWRRRTTRAQIRFRRSRHGRFLPSVIVLIESPSMHTALILATACTAVLSAAPLDRKDVEYGRPGGTALLLDMHVPDGTGPFPAAILIHGGGFDEGSKSTNMRPTFEPLAQAGFAWFSIDYRLAPKFHQPDASEDVNTAIRWVKAHAAEYHLDPSKIALIGESAGGYLVNYAGTHMTPETKVAAVVDFYGPVDYAKLAELRRDHPERFNMTSINKHAANGSGIHFFGADQLDAAGLAKLHAASPIFAVHKGMPPFLAIHGTKDDQVVYEQSTAMCEAMHKVGATCDLITVEGGGHGMSGWRAPEMQHWKPEMISWLQKTLNVK